MNMPIKSVFKDLFVALLFWLLVVALCGCAGTGPHPGPLPEGEGEKMLMPLPPALPERPHAVMGAGPSGQELLCFEATGAQQLLLRDTAAISIRDQAVECAQGFNALADAQKLTQARGEALRQAAQQAQQDIERERLGAFWQRWIERGLFALALGLAL